MKRVRPVFIVFEGIDGSGKTTICEAVYRHYTKTGFRRSGSGNPRTGGGAAAYARWIRKDAMAAPEEQVRLFIRDREDDVATNIRPALESGKMVLLDRYYYSNAAYQAPWASTPAV